MMPEWFEEWVIPETDNWHLKPGAPEWVQKEFAEWMGQHDTEANGVCVD
jgi:hypothetical protein